MHQDQSGKEPLSTQLNDEEVLDPLSDGAGKTTLESQGKPPSALSNHINLEELRLSQNYASTVGVKKRLTTVPTRKPSKHSFFRVNTDPAYQLSTMVLELKEERETYLVMPNLYAELAGEITPKILRTCVTREGVCFLWPLKLPGEDGRLDPWSQSALDAADIGTKKWIRLVSNQSLGAYEVYEAASALSEPNWPDVTFEELVSLAFKGKIIEDYEHPILRQLRGEN